MLLRKQTCEFLSRIYHRNNIPQFGFSPSGGRVEVGSNRVNAELQTGIPNLAVMLFGGAGLLTSRLARTLAPPKIEKRTTIPNLVDLSFRYLCRMLGVQFPVNLTMK